MKIYYFWDALCGWCYGFDAVLLEFYEKYKDIEIEVISGGLFVLSRSQKISNYPHIKGANERISEFFWIKFWEKYNEILEKWELILNSYHPAVIFSILKEKISNEKQFSLANDFQKIFFEEWKSLSDLQTYIEIAEKYSIKSEEVEKIFEEKLSKKY